MSHQVIIHYLLQQFLRCRGTNEAGDVDIDERGHQELAVEAVHDAAVAGDHVTKVLETVDVRRYVEDYLDQYA